jgi:hypothetical protein
MTQAKPARRLRKAAPKPPRPATSFAPAPTRARRDGWTPDRQIAFIDALAASGCVKEACATIGISPRSAYALRARIDAQGFRLAWDAALDYAIRRLSDECLSRALNGVAVPHYFQGQQVGEHRRYDNRLAMFLLRYRDPLHYAATLDRMVYDGHVEGAAIRLAKARDRAEDEAHGVADQDCAPDAPPFTVTPITEEQARQDEEALVRSNAPIRGSQARRTRLQEQRAQRCHEELAERRATERADLVAAIARLSGKSASGGDVV